MARLSVLHRQGSDEDEFEGGGEAEALDEAWWFDTESAHLTIENEQDWNGSNSVSRTTGDQFSSETLYVTATRRYALHFTSSYQNTPDRVTELDVNQVVNWLIRNGTDAEEYSSELPSEIVEEYRIRQG